MKLFSYKIWVLLIVCLYFGCIRLPAIEVKINDKDFNQAIKQGNIEFIEQNISKIEDLDSGYCFLCTAAEKKQDKILDLLLANNANPDCPASTISPLYTALVYDNTYAIQKLLEAGADPNNTTNLPPIYLAIANNNVDNVKSLLEAGADTDATFLKMKASELAFSGRHPEIEEVFISYWNKDIKTPATDINKALDILKESENGNKYYRILTGDNPTGKPYKILFCDIQKISQGKYNVRTYIRHNYYNKQTYIYIDNADRDMQPEVLATLLAGESIHIDTKNSIIENLVSFGIMGNVWKELAAKNPELNKIDSQLVKGFNGVIKILELNTQNMTPGDYNNLWLLSGMTFSKNKTSKGYKNKDLNTYFSRQPN